MNVFEDSFLNIVAFAREGDLLGAQQAFDELTFEQRMDIWWRLSSLSKRRLKDIGLNVKGEGHAE